MVFRVWRNPPKGSDTYRSFQSARGAAKHALKLHKKGQLNDVVVYKKGRGERALNRTESLKLNKVTKRLARKR